MKAYFFLLLLAFSQTTYSQSYFLQDGRSAFDTITTHFFQLGAERVDQSNALSREFLTKLAFGGHISNDSKEFIRARLDGQNYYGSQFTPGLTYTYFKPGKNSGWSFSYNFRSLNSLEFTDDLYTIFFYGNSEFRESPAILGESSLRIFNYQSLSLGWVDKKTGSNIKLGLYDNRQYSQIDISETTLSTIFNTSAGQPFAEELILQAGSFSSRQSNNGSLFKTGIGLGISGEYSLHLKKGQFIFKVEDLGAMYMNNLSVSDTSGVFKYGGVEWNIGQDSPLNNVFSNLEDSLSPATRKVNEWVLLPALFQISYVSPKYGNIFFRAEGAYRVQMGFKPEFGIAVNYAVVQNNSFWVRPSVGGFSDFSVGLGTQISVFNKTLFQLGSNHLFGVFSGKGKATSLFIQIVQKI